MWVCVPRLADLFIHWLCSCRHIVEREEGNCEVEYVACGSGLERIYRFLQSDEGCNRPTADLDYLARYCAVAPTPCTLADAPLTVIVTAAEASRDKQGIPT